MSRSKLTSKYQATIPKEIRELLKLEAGDSIYFTICEGNNIVVKKAQPISILMRMKKLSKTCRQTTPFSPYWTVPQHVKASIF